MSPELQFQSVYPRLQAPVFRAIGKLTRPFRYRGVGVFSRVLSWLSPPSLIIREIAENARIEFDLTDLYWSKLVYPDYIYEPEIQSFINHYVGRDFAFFDCGANIGYWSVMLAARLPANRVIAVEASPSTFIRLERNRSLNHNSFSSRQAAIYHQDDQQILFNPGKCHASSHIDFEHTAQDKHVGVTTITLNTLYRQHLPPDFTGWILVKLDVEGAEIAALQAADELMATGRFLLIYEDHGKDPTSRVSHYIMENLNLEIYSIMGERIQRMKTLDAIGELKTDPIIGYNFLATSPGTLEALMSKPI